MNNQNNSLFVFPDTGAQVRVVQIDGNPWFVAADVCRALGMDVALGVFRWLRSVLVSLSRAIYPVISTPPIFGVLQNSR